MDKIAEKVLNDGVARGLVDICFNGKDGVRYRVLTHSGWKPEKPKRRRKRAKANS